jgi:RNA polymerase sigma factor (TIGR02999 family)
MDAPAKGEITLLLHTLGSDREDRATAAGRLFELVYSEMQRIAVGLMRRERDGHTLQPTALVHEAYMRLVDQTRIRWEDRAHFFRVAVAAMRRVLVDHARALATEKRGGGWQRVTLDEALAHDGGLEFEVIELDNALSRLGALDERMEQVVAMRAFGGMEIREIAHVLDVSERTVYGDWEMARRWLDQELAGGDAV